MNNNISVGWECPKCGKVNAPFVRNCDCHIPTPKDIALPATPGFVIPADKDYKNHCLWDSMPETSPGSGVKMGMLSCPCPKCSPRC